MKSEIGSYDAAGDSEELSGVTLEAVQQIRREPVTEAVLARVLERARQLDDPESIPRSVNRQWTIGRVSVAAGIAAAAIIGLRSNPKTGYRTPAAIGTPSAL